MHVHTTALSHACTYDCTGLPFVRDVQDYNPVCATNGRTFDNACLAKCVGAKVDYTRDCIQHHLVQGACANKIKWSPEEKKYVLPEKQAQDQDLVPA